MPALLFPSSPSDINYDKLLTYYIREKEQLRREKEQLRGKEEQLREERLLLLRAQGKFMGAPNSHLVVVLDLPSWYPRAAFGLHARTAVQCSWSLLCLPAWYVLPVLVLALQPQPLARVQAARQLPVSIFPVLF